MSLLSMRFLWQYAKWIIVQNLILFLVPYLWGYNAAMFWLIALYTFAFSLYWHIIPKAKRLDKLYIPYLIYVVTVIIFRLFNSSISLWYILLPLYGALLFIAVKLIKKKCRTTLQRVLTILAAILAVILLKVASVNHECSGHGSKQTEKEEILQRRDYLVSKLITTPENVMAEMPSGIDKQFKGEWALYSCSMLSASLVNISSAYPDTKAENLQNIDKLIQIVLSRELRSYDKERWGEDPLTSLDGDKSHISYLSHLAWMMCGYKAAGGGTKYDKQLSALCQTMNRRLEQSECLNLPTYPDEPIYLPDMLVSIIALSQYSQMNHHQYSGTVEQWLKRAKTEWIDKKTGLLVSFITNEGEQIDGAPVKGSYSALNCSYLTYLDEDFAHQQYNRLKGTFLKDGLVVGFKEYHNHDYLCTFDIDAGPILFGLSPSGTAFAMGAVTYFNDSTLRTSLLTTAEIAGQTLHSNGQRHYALADVAIVGEAIMLAMRTHYKENTIAQ